MHWSFAVPQIVLMATGGWLLVFSSGSGETELKVRIIMFHKVTAVCFVLLPLLVFMRGNNGTLLANIKLGLSWSRNDLRWLFLSFLKLFRPSTNLPDVGKFNAGQKLNMLALMGIGPLFVLSGSLMWLFEGVLMAWIVHAGLFILVLFFVAGHVYMALLHPSTRHSFWGIVTGNVDWEWAFHHHPEWAKEMNESNASENKTL